MASDSRRSAHFLNELAAALGMEYRPYSRFDALAPAEGRPAVSIPDPMELRKKRGYGATKDGERKRRTIFILVSHS